MTLRLAAFAAAAFLIAQPTLAKDLERATPESTGLSKVEMDKLKAAMAQIVASGQRAGIVYAVAHKGKLVALEAIGKRDLEKNLPMEVDTQFHLASLSRVLSGGTILSLVDEGKLKMSDPVSKYIPEFAQTPVLKSVDGDTVVTEGLDRLQNGSQVASRTPVAIKSGASAGPGGGPGKSGERKRRPKAPTP